MSKTNDKGLNPRALLESINDGVYAVDTERRITYWSPAAERITGWSANNILGKHCFDDVLCHIDKDGHQLCGNEHCPLHRAMVTGRGSDLPVVVFAQHKDGRRIPMRVSVAPVRDASGQVIGGVEIFRDASKEHRDAELTRRIQSAMLRRQILEDRRVTFSTYYMPWGMVGGDFYGTAKVDDDRFAFMLADVSGHGFTAALSTVYLNALWQMHRGLLPRLSELARAMHSELTGLVSDDARFATAIFVLLDLKKMCATITYAGGPPPILFHADGTLDVVTGTGLPLGLPVDGEYSELTVPIRPGDCLLAFTDGVLEIADASGRLLEIEGLLRILAEVGYPESGDLGAVEEELLIFSDVIRFNDDLTFFEARLAPASGA
jgi:PAS domain S-box-containing protein